ncbi:hypothetical protein [Clostridium perfringens]|uniref:hypothetical protein n=1 Tax=Clostridium perfringens TaxID=1502 RepID=UPI00096A6E80|nr:hypothetical protein [Clostridium perfringens]
MDIIDKKFKIKKFLKTIFRDIDFTKEKIRTLQINKDESYRKVEFFDDIDELVDYSVNKYSKFNNTYFNLNTVDGGGGANENLLYRYCLGFDFDKKDLGQDFNHKDIINLFKKLKIYCSAIIDSGNGYHAYILLNKTDRLDLVQKVQEVLCNKLGADKDAIKPTQILRIPYTYNVKDKLKLVRIIHLADRNSSQFKPYDIEFLYNKNCKNICVADNKVTKFVLSNTNIPACIEKILTTGTQEGDRYKDLCNIVVALRLRNRSLKEITEVCKEWAIKSNYKDNLEYRIEHIYNNKLALELDCKACKSFTECYNRVLSNFDYSENDKLITLTETTQKYLKNSNRKGAKVMKPNDLLVYCILKNHNDGLTREEIQQELTYTKKKQVKNIALSDRTLKDTLKSLLENGFITVEKGVKQRGEKDKYFLKESRSKIELTYNISFAATYECVKGNISTEELRLYNYMRYLHNKQQREDEGSLKGNLFQINQVELAKHLDVTQQRISQMIENLLDEKLLSIWYRQTSKNNGFEYNIYRLNY